MAKCILCGKEYRGYGRNAQPLKEGLCCEDCFFKDVNPKRINDSLAFAEPSEEVIQEETSQNLYKPDVNVLYIYVPKTSEYKTYEVDENMKNNGIDLDNFVNEMCEAGYNDYEICDGLTNWGPGFPIIIVKDGQISKKNF